jgi:methyl-accepting chemotaxis protein
MGILSKIRISLSIRLLFGVLIVAGFIYFLTIRYINYDYEESAITLAEEKALQQAENLALNIQNIFNGDFEQFRVFAAAYEELYQKNGPTQRPYLDETLKRMVMDNPRYYSAWDSWELRFIDENWTEPYGRISIAYFKENGFIEKNLDTLDYYGDDTARIYYDYKTNPREGFTEPYLYNFSNSESDAILMSSIIVPLMKGQEFMGMVGADIGLLQLKNLVDSLNNTFEGYAYIISNQGAFVAHPDTAFLGKNIAEVDSIFNTKYQVLEKIQKGEINSFEIVDRFKGKQYFTSIVPITFGSSNDPWGVAINAPLENIILEAQSHFKESRQVGVYGLIALIIVILLIAFQIIRPLRKTTTALYQLSKGDIEGINRINIRTGDEIEQMGRSVNQIIKGFRDTVEFANHIKKGDFNKEFTPLSEKDVLGNAVLEMRDSLKSAKEEEAIRKIEEEHTNWTSEGINLFGDILRQDNDNLSKLSMRIISTLVDYLGAHQGGLYLVEGNKEEKYLELVASIGYEKDKMRKTTVYPNEGFVGQCFLEKERIYRDEIPKDYPPILSGLGKTLPGSLLIVPMLINEQVVGIIEVASLKSLEKFQIEFVERISVPIASTTSSAKINAQTAFLLEKSKEQADELAQQEEEMRQNMEELQAMQEEATNREESIQNFINAAKSTILYIEYNMDARITHINDNMVQLFNLKREQVIDKKVGSYEFSSSSLRDRYENIWEKLRNGKPATNNFYSKYSGKEFYLNEYYFPIMNEVGVPYKVVNIAVDVSDEKRKEKQLETLKEEYKKLSEKIQVKEEKTKPKISINEVLAHDSYFEYLDLTHLKKVYKDDFNKIQNILIIYLNTIPNQVEELMNLAQGDLGMLKSKIGSFRTKMIYLGLTRVVEMSKEIETAVASGGDRETISDLLDEINSIWNSAAKEIKTLVDRG